MNHKPRKRFGQNFLTDSTVLHNIALAIAPKANQHIIEIGPGQGALTEYLLKHPISLDVIELDRDLVALLTEKYKHTNNITIHSGDALNFDYNTLQTSEKKLRIVGNLPYNISSPLLFKLFDHLDIIEDMLFLLQKEVVDRLTAEVNTKHYGRLSIMSHYFCDSYKVLDIKPSSFYPAPKVNSAFIHMIPIERPLKAQNFKHFSDTVRQAFCYRRKMISNSLKDIITPTELEKLGINPNARPQELSIDDYIRISNHLDSTLK